MFNAWTWDRRAVWRAVALAAALTGSARAGAEIGSPSVVTVPGITLPLTTSTVTLPVTTSTAATTTLPLPLTTTTVTLPPLPTTTLGRVSTPRSGAPLGRSRAVIGPVRLHSSIPIVQARRFRVDPSASETRKVVGEGAAPTSRTSEGGTIVYVAPVSTRNRTLALRRAKTRASA